MAVDPLISDEFVIRRVWVPREHVVFVRGVFEASEGVAAVFSVKGGDLTFAADPSRLHELDELLADLQVELGRDLLRLGLEEPHEH